MPEGSDMVDLREEDGTIPELWPELEPIFRAHATLGRDMNGRTLYAERLAWVGRQGFDPGEEEFALACFDAIEEEVAAVQAEEAEALREKHKH